MVCLGFEPWTARTEGAHEFTDLWPPLALGIKIIEP